AHSPSSSGSLASQGTTEVANVRQGNRPQHFPPHPSPSLIPQSHSPPSLSQHTIKCTPTKTVYISWSCCPLLLHFAFHYDV
ncbi:hypothetical protein SK128_016147, partial [Halocaridina rubra]